MQPAARAEAVSPPATLNANGKLLAAKTATGPIGRRMLRRSGRDPGGQLSSGESMAASKQSPSSITPARNLSWNVVRPARLRGAPRRAGLDARQADELVGGFVQARGDGTEHLCSRRRLGCPPLGRCRDRPLHDAGHIDNRVSRRERFGCQSRRLLVTRLESMGASPAGARGRRRSVIIVTPPTYSGSGGLPGQSSAKLSASSRG